MKEVSNDKEYQAFTLEAKIAKIYFSKDVFHLLQSGKGDKLAGYCVGAPAANPNAINGGSGGQNYGRQDVSLYISLHFYLEYIQSRFPAVETLRSNTICPDSWNGWSKR